MQAVEPSSIPVRGAELWPLSVAAYHVLGEAGLIPKNTELLYGFVCKKLPKSPLHAYLLQGVHELLSRCELQGFLIRAEQPITCVDSEPEPDISIVAGSRKDYAKGHPQTAELVVEICVTSIEYDRSKLKAYALAHVKECWLVMAAEKKVEVYSQPVNGQYEMLTVIGPGGVLKASVLSAARIDLNELFEK